MIETLAKFRNPSLGIKEFYDPVAKLEKEPVKRDPTPEEATTFQEVLLKILGDKKHDLSVFFKTLILKYQGDISQGIEIDVVNDTVKKTFSKTLNKSEIHIFIDGIDKNNDSLINIQEMIDLLKDSMNDPLDRIKLYFSFLATVLDKKNQSTGILG